MKAMRSLLLFSLCQIASTASAVSPPTDHRPVTYQPTWESLDKRPIPEWYDDGECTHAVRCVPWTRVMTLNV